MQLKYKLLFLFFVLLGLLSCRTISSAGSSRQPGSSNALLRYYKAQPDFNAPSISHYFSEENRLNTYFNDRKDSVLFIPFLDSLRLEYPIEWEYVDHLVRYVQENISYEKFNPGDDIKYPLETFIEGSGVCSDQSILLGKMLVYSGYNISLFTFPEAEHIGVGLKVPQKYGSYNTPYIYIETTNIRPLGNIPFDSFKKGDLENPTLIEIDENGERAFTSVRKLLDYYDSMEASYGEDFLFLDMKSRFLNIRINRMQQVVDSLKSNLEILNMEYEAMHEKLTSQHNEIATLGCNGVISDEKLFEECEKKVSLYNKQVEKVNSVSANLERESGITNLLVNELNKLVDEYNVHINEMNNQ